MSFSSCFGGRKARDNEREPLLPKYNDDTVMQREVHQKLHSYQMVRALSKGYMPSNEQVITNLRTLLGSDLLNPIDAELSDSGRHLVKFAKQWLRQFIDLLVHKNSRDQIQDFLWFLTMSRISLDADDIARRASNVKARADTMAAYKSFQTVGSLLLTNPDFRLFLSDVQTVGREVFKDTALKLSDVAETVGKEVGPSDAEEAALADPKNMNGEPPSGKDLASEATDVAKAIDRGAAEVGKETVDSLKNHLSGGEKQSLIERLKRAVSRLRQRPDYNDSVSTISLLIKRYALVYSRVAEETASAVQDDVNANDETGIAVKNFWSLLRSFGEEKEWVELEKRFKQAAEHQKRSPDFERLMTEFGNALQKLLTDPDFIQNADSKFEELRNQNSGLEGADEIRNDIARLVEQTQRTFQSVIADKDVAALLQTTLQIASVLSPAHSLTNHELIHDCINIFIPLLINAIQYIPIPRLEVSAPEIDLLLENLILEPGKTVNHTSFLPFRARLETFNAVELRAARVRTVSTATSTSTIKIDGLSIRADEVGFWLRAHSGIFRLADAGIASFALDERGLDIHIDVEIGQDRLEKILTLKAVRVHIHKLNYNLRKSKFAWIAWLAKPILRPILRKVLERQLSTAIADFFHAANRELLYARERLRATRISDPQDLITFVRAVAARLTPEDDPDLYSRVGVDQPGKGVFKGVYAPGSVVKLWKDEAEHAGEIVDDYQREGWRNKIFDLGTVVPP